MNSSVVNHRFLLGLAVVGLAVTASAETVTGLCEQTSRAESMFTEAMGSPTSDSSMMGKYYYSDKLAPHADADYVCTALMGPPFVSGSTTNHTFGGKSCTASHFSLFACWPNQMTFPRDGLILAAGADFRERNQDGQTYIINGKVRIDGTSSAPTYIKKTSVDGTKGYRSTYVFTGAFSSKDANSRLALLHYGSNPGLPGLFDLQLAGDVSGYTGTIEVYPTYGTNWLSFVGAAQTFPGTVKLTKNAELHISGSTTSLANLNVLANTSVLTIAATNDLTVGKLTMADGLTLPVRTAWTALHTGHLTVTDASSLAGKLALSVDFPTFTVDDLISSSGRAALLTVPTDYDNYTITYPEVPVRAGFGTLPEFSLVTETNDTTKTVYLTHKKIIFNVERIYDNKDILTNGKYWSDNEPLTNAAALYWTTNDIRFSRDVTAYRTAFKDISFISANHFYLADSDFAAKRLQLVASTAYPQIVMYAHCANTVTDLVTKISYQRSDVATFTCGSFEFLKEDGASTGGIVIQSYDGHFINFRGPMVGTCDIWFKARGVNSKGVAASGGYIYFENGLANFTGKLVSTKASASDFNDWDQRSSTYGSKWVVSKTTNLGAPLSSFTPDAISLRYLNGIYNLCDVTLDELTRGIYVGGGTAADAVGFFVTPEGTTLTVKQALRINGRLKKEGPGTLVLAQAEEQKLTFGTAANKSDTPTANCNILKVQAGKLSVKTKFAADGLALTFTNGTSLVVTPGATAETALYNVNGTVASECTGDLAGKIPVSFDTTGKAAGDELTGVICTVASTSALTKDSFVMTTSRPFGSGSKSYMFDVTASTDGSGNKVFTATAHPCGAIIFLR